MSDQFTLVHEADPSIRVTLKAPSRAAFAAYWDNLASNGGRPTFTAKHNLTLACGDGTDAFRDLLEEEWSSLPEVAAPLLFVKAGHFGTDDVSPEYMGEVVDLRAVYDALTKADAAAERAGAAGRHASAMVALGIKSEMIAAWLNCRNPKISRLCVRLPNGGYYAARGPKISDRVASSNVHRAPASEDESGPYAALVRFVLDCALWSGPGPIDKMIDEHPGYGSRLGAMVRDLNGGYKVDEGK